MFRISHRGQGIDDSDTLKGAREIVRGGQPGRYDVDEIRAGPGQTNPEFGGGGS
jgi:hypothetical protein